MVTQISKKRKFAADGVFFAGLNEVLTRELVEDGYSGVEVRVTRCRDYHSCHSNSNVIVSGKLCAQRAKSMKFKDGYLISSGQPVKDYIDLVVRHVKIMFDWDPKGKQSLTTPLPDLVTIQTPNHTSMTSSLKKINLSEI
ncbi:hypothetical protein AAG906_031108 [Vitis piasezkii]